jgi:hypothetical protein
MTKKQIKIIRDKNSEIWEKLRETLEGFEIDLVIEYVENEILLEAESNK